MYKKIFIAVFILLVSLIFSTYFNSAFAQGSVCKVNFCNCCHDSDNAFYTVYDFFADTVVATFTIGAGGCTPGLSFVTGNTYRVEGSCRHGTIFVEIYFTACICIGTDTVRVPCCSNPGGDDKTNFLMQQNRFNPKEFALYQNYPNPFNPSTNIQFYTPSEGFVKLSVYDVTGKQIAVLLNGNVKRGNHEVVWNATNYSSGVYFYKLEAGSFTTEKKMMVIK